MERCTAPWAVGDLVACSRVELSLSSCQVPKSPLSFCQLWKAPLAPPPPHTHLFGSSSVCLCAFFLQGCRPDWHAVPHAWELEQQKSFSRLHPSYTCVHAFCFWFPCFDTCCIFFHTFAPSTTATDSSHPIPPRFIFTFFVKYNRVSPVCLSCRAGLWHGPSAACFLACVGVQLCTEKQRVGLYGINFDHNTLLSLTKGRKEHFPRVSPFSSQTFFFPLRFCKRETRLILQLIKHICGLEIYRFKVFVVFLSCVKSRQTNGLRNCQLCNTCTYFKPPNHNCFTKPNQAFWLC